MFEILFLVVSVLLIYLLIVKPQQYWSKRNVKTGRTVPFFGDNFRIILGKESSSEMFQRIYNKVQNVRYIGIYQFLTPVLFLKSPELMKQICVKDFDHFLNHKGYLPDGVDELWSKNLVGLKGQSWKNMRSVLSPTFTSSKMKSMFTLMCHNAELFSQHFMKKTGNVTEVEFKDAFTRYTNDVIASTAFGLQVDSLEDKNNEFYLMGKEVSELSSLRRKLVVFAYQLFPTISTFFRIPMFGKKIKDFFINLVKETIKIREEQNIKRPDMLGLLIQARKGQPSGEHTSDVKEVSFAVVEEHLAMTEAARSLSDMDIASQVFVFFLGGFETVSTAMCFMAYELAVNPNIQKKLIEEIDQNKPQKEPPTYELLCNMTYMDMVVTETLRKWPVTIATERVVTKPYVIEPKLPGEKPVHLEKDTLILIPTFAIHRDPQYYEHPEKFDPERFSPENRKNINPYAYMPFGVGPRNCIGSRFALLEVKAVFFYLLSNFEIIPVEKTVIPLKTSRTSLTLTSENGFTMGLKKRELSKLSCS
ncbi:hypothetical protein WA026_010843 [Henosepilachna vigintioctopunctata]|uniref:Cytochrome P450 n=1 Tax=Henosepilachna vigintioctopunctata TaxID=420089 RepID=A0AAW1UZP6_9CUCU